ncbi:MAG TPA: hypothetical protein VFQ85_05585 [Mycobacteriales bacterium]|jgi:hypothetical protein|nr:hypothetical protein [Mycobacteriales bacterium]
MRQRVYGATAALALASCAFAVPASAAQVRWLTIRADRSASTTVRLSRSTVLYLGEPGDDGPVVQISGGGKAAGFLLTPTDHPAESVGQLSLTDERGQTRYSLGDERQPIPSGTYLLRVIAESSPVVVRVPVSGASASWRATKRISTSRAEAVWDTPAGAVVLGGADVTLPPSSLALFVLRYEANGMGENRTVCLTHRLGICGPNEGAWLAASGIERTFPVVARSAGFGVFADRPASGSFTARWKISAKGLAAQPSAFAFVVG